MPDSHICPMNREERIQEQEEYEAMLQELYNIQKEIRMVWRQQQKGLIDEWRKEDLK